MADEATLQAQLAEAEAALHALMIGEAVVEADYEGHRQKFTRARAPELRRYIAVLKRQLGQDVARMSRRVVF
ncbi:gpW protein [Salinihabitans flavidus]|uniref:GpW protein n=1 Tax=Salinihabitans flavidus TaxID=569882 RepID=A0A1H8WLX1_9RHOB|nr:gpW family head-tail joining protein [Salinihabitans flavidus]SEP28523.1 gpW protein [Salinihabitans flavidus]